MHDTPATVYGMFSDRPLNGVYKRRHAHRAISNSRSAILLIFNQLCFIPMTAYLDLHKIKMPQQKNISIGRIFMPRDSDMQITPEQITVAAPHKITIRIVSHILPGLL